MPAREALEKLDSIIADLVEADQTGAGMEPLDLAHELGRVRSLLVERPAVLPRQGGEMHFRCESCGTISHASKVPQRCPACGATKLFRADLEQPIVDAGPA